MTKSKGKRIRKMVITIGLEPTTSSMSRKYSTTELRDLLGKCGILLFFDLKKGYKEKL